MNPIWLTLCILCIALHAQYSSNCVQSMAVNDGGIGGGGLFAKFFGDATAAIHHVHHSNQSARHHHRHRHQQHHHATRHRLDAGNHNDIEHRPHEVESNHQHTQPSNKWHLMGQTINSDDINVAKNNINDNHYDDDAVVDDDEHELLMKMNKKQHELHQKTVNCPKCQNRPELRMTEGELTKLRIEYVKNQILKKLRMTERPKVSTSYLPRPVAEGSMIFPDDEDEQQNHASEQFYGKTTQKIIFLQLDNEKCKGVENFGSYMCFTFNIPADIDYNDVDAAELWVYRQPDPNANDAQSFLVSEIESWDSKKINKPFAIHYANSSEGWGKIDFTWSIRNWMKYKNLYHVIDISCNTCEKHPTLDLFSLDHGYRPFIVVNTTSSQTIKRQRRSINCSPGISECCRDKLYISFADIGWNDWILNPPGYDAYFCRGSCASAATITSNASYYNLLVRKMNAVKQSSSYNKEKSFELVPCCTATQFSSLQLFYMETNTTATRKVLPNMVVEACGCM